MAALLAGRVTHNSTGIPVHKDRLSVTEQRQRIGHVENRGNTELAGNDRAV
jgi:hypothetical protein